MRIPCPAAFMYDIGVVLAIILSAACTRTGTRARTKVRGPATLRACLLVFLLGVASSVSAQAPPDVGALDAYFTRALADWEVPGMSVAIVKDGRVVLQKGYGVRERGKPEHVDERTLFAIASNTKAFTAAAVAVLVDQQKVEWDEPVRSYLPRFELQDPWRQPTCACAICCPTAAAWAPSAVICSGTTRLSTSDDVLRRVRYLQPRSPFRTTFGYSNLMFLAAGQVVAAASGTSVGGLRAGALPRSARHGDTLTSVRAAPGPRQRGHATWAGGHGVPPVPAGQLGGRRRGGRSVSSARDMTRWLLLQLGRGTLDGRQYFTDEQARTMWTPHVSLTISRESETASPTTHFNAYGLGWMLRDYHGRLIASHGGGLDGMYSAVAVVPDERLGVVVLTNGMTGIGDALVMRVIDAYLDLPAVSPRMTGALKDSNARERTNARAPHGWQMCGRCVCRARSPRFRSSIRRALHRPVLRRCGRHARRRQAGDAAPREPAARRRSDAPAAGYLRPGVAPRFPVVLGRDSAVHPEQGGGGRELKLDVPNEDFWFDEIDLRKVAP